MPGHDYFLMASSSETSFSLKYFSRIPLKVSQTCIMKIAIGIVWEILAGGGGKNDPLGFHIDQNTLVAYFESEKPKINQCLLYLNFTWNRKMQTSR